MTYYVILVALLMGTAMCTNGVTTRTLIKDFSCFKSNHYIYAIVRAFLNVGRVDPNAKETLKVAAAQKLLYADIYANPCIECKMTPETTVDVIVDALKETTYNNFWLVITPNDKWTANTTYNCDYANRFLRQAKKLGKSPGIGSDAPSWEKVMGKGCEITVDYAGCWWLKHDKEQSFEKFKPFGGFTFPTIKEFDGPSKMCNMDVDLNFCNC